MRIYLDVETVPSQQPDARDRVRQGLKPPGALKKPESIASWWNTESASAVDEAWRRQSLDGGTDGEIVSIAVCGDDDPGWVTCRKPGEPEAGLLLQFAAEVQRRLDEATVHGADGSPTWPPDPYFIAHNAAFDVGYLWRRMRVHRISPAFRLPDPAARVGKDYGCTMFAWSGYGGRVSLDTLCRALGVPSPKAGGLDGAGVLDAWLAGQVDAIAQYNLADARACRDVWHILAGVTA